MWTVCITSISHVLKLNGHGGLQAKVNEKRLCFKGWETLVTNLQRKFDKLLFFSVFIRVGNFSKDILPHRKIRSKIRYIELYIPHFRYCTLYRILILLQTLINTHRIVFI